MKLGAAVRLIEAYFASLMLAVIGYGLITPTDDFVYDVSLLLIAVVMVASAGSIWLIELRSRAVRRFVPVALAVMTALSIVDVCIGTSYVSVMLQNNAVGFIISELYFYGGALAAGLYCALAPHAKALFTQSIKASSAETGPAAAGDAQASSAVAGDARAGLALAGDAQASSAAAGDAQAGEGRSASQRPATEAPAVSGAVSSHQTSNGESTHRASGSKSAQQASGDKPARLIGRYDEKPFTWPWVRNLVIYYCAFSILGHWAEIAFCSMIVLGVFMGEYDFNDAQMWSEWLCPFPPEGIAVVLIVVLLVPFKNWLMAKLHGKVIPALIITFVVTTLICTSIDLTMGLIINGNYEYWDYRDMPFNFMGQIVLQNSLVYGIAATLILWAVYPLIARFMHKAPKHILDGVFVGFVAFYLFLEVLYFVNISPTGLVFG